MSEYMSFRISNEIELGGTETGITSNSGKSVETFDFDKLLLAWQQKNFPGKSKEDLFSEYPKSETYLHEAMRTGETVTIEDTQYLITEMIGLGKESKAFCATTTDGERVAVKVGLQSLKEEYDYGVSLQQKSDRFPKYLGYDEEKNIVVMEMIEGQIAEEVVQRLKEPEQWVNFLRETSSAVVEIERLYQEGAFAGQFNLRNLISDERGRFRIIDPFFEGSKEEYEAKQMMRIAAVLVEKIYKTEPGMFPLQVKSATSATEVRSLKYPVTELDKLETSEINIPQPIKGELDRVFRKYLTDGLGNYSFEDLAKDFAGLEFLCNAYVSIESGEKDFFTETPKGVVLDLNGTFEDGGFINTRVANILKTLSDRETPVAIISGKSIESIQETLQRANLNIEMFDVFSDAGTAYYHKGVLTEETKLENKESLLENMESYLSVLGVKANVRSNERRVNIQLSPNDLPHMAEIQTYVESLGFSTTLTVNGTQLDIIAKGLSKGSALARVAHAYQVSETSLVKIGNEPHGNDKEILFEGSDKLKPNAFPVESVAHTAYILEQVMNEIGYGAKHKSERVPFENGFLDDFRKATTEEVKKLCDTAQANNDVFYPYFALKDRLSLKDPKSVDYKWLVRNNDNVPIGMTSIYELKDQPGVYNIGGFYLSPEARGTGIALNSVRTMYDFASANIEGFKGFRIRVSELNYPSRRLLEKLDWTPTDFIEGDYVLIVEGEEQRTNTIVYELGTSISQQIDLENDERLLPIDEVRTRHRELSVKDVGR